MAISIKAYWSYIDLFLLLFMELAYVPVIKSDIFNECSNTSEATFVSSSQNCSHFIFCDGENSYDGDCGLFYMFNESFQTCDPMETADCPDDSDESQEFTSVAITTPTSTTVPIQNLTSPTIITQSSQNTNLITIPTQSTIMSEYDTPIRIVAEKCPEIDDPLKLILLPHATSCSNYYYCFRGNPALMQCNMGLHFDRQSGLCEQPDRALCWAKVPLLKDICQSQKAAMYPHSSNCNYFYSCKHGYLILQQCPFMFGWNYEQQTCQRLSQTKCYI